MNKRSERLIAEMWRVRFIDAMQYYLLTGRIPPERKS